jgi:hypothetical protein
MAERALQFRGAPGELGRLCSNLGGIPGLLLEIRGDGVELGGEVPEIGGNIRRDAGRRELPRMRRQLALGACLFQEESGRLCHDDLLQWNTGALKEEAV